MVHVHGISSETLWLLETYFSAVMHQEVLPTQQIMTLAGHVIQR